MICSGVVGLLLLDVLALLFFSCVAAATRGDGGMTTAAIEGEATVLVGVLVFFAFFRFVSCFGLLASRNIRPGLLISFLHLLADS
jgi:hypothetical protein